MRIFIILALFPTFAFAAKGSAVATVNGTEISKEFFDNSYKRNLMFVSEKKVTPEKVINDLINRELGIQKAKSNKLESDPVVQQKMLDVLYHAQMSKDLEPLLRKIKVTDKDVKGYYKKNPEYRTAQILFRVKAVPEEGQGEAALAKAMEVYDTVKKNPDQFTALANKYSQSSSAPMGGDLGFQPAVSLAPEYFEAINGKAKGYITSPIRSQFGYHVVKILAKRKFADINKAQYKKLVYDKKRDAVIEKYFSELRSKANIKIDKNLLK